MAEAKAYKMIPHCTKDTITYEMDELVRCMDCKHGVKSPTFRYYPEITWCNKFLKSHNDEWYCADGERR